jgi:hypothetical protein
VLLGGEGDCGRTGDVLAFETELLVANPPMMAMSMPSNIEADPCMNRMSVSKS